jgi:OOP family OmpA-OmpF porin
MKRVMVLCLVLNHLLCGQNSIDKTTFKLTDTLVKNGTCALSRIQYTLGKATLLSESHEELDSVVWFLNRNPNLVIEIGAHTSRTNVQMCSNLSQARAYSVVEYLISKGIQKERIYAKGYGFSRELFNEEAIKKIKDKKEHETLRAKNRRTEIRVIRADYIPIPETGK